MKKFSILLCALLWTTIGSAQLNMTLRSEVKYNEDLNDVWGYAANDREYALVGLRGGVNIVDVTDPDTPVDMGTATGASSTWRDIKTWDGFAYITNETGGGVMVIDLRGLPTPITNADYYNWEPNLAGMGQLGSCHNIFVDEFGYGYITGCNLNSGGAIFLDLFTTPGTPIHVGNGPAIYGHDIYTRDNIMYSSEINAGRLGVYNVEDKSNPVFINSQNTPSNFTHNAWLSDDSKVVFTTDERANAPVAAYDITDLSDINELDQYRPITTLGEGVIPHNVHVWQDWLIISYYTDGCIVVDGSRPSNLIEVGNFDTFINGSGGFDGVWGVYPFLPSLTVLASDIGNGLFVITPNYKRACWLEGVVSNKETGAKLNDVEVSIDATQDNQANTDFQGAYETGLADAGTYDVTFSKFGFFPQTISTALDNGVLVTLNVELEPINTSASGKITNEDTGMPIPFAIVSLVGDQGAINAQADANGSFSLQSFIPGNYDLFVGSWGFQTKESTINIADGDVVNIALKPGYKDDFALDLGWTATGTASTGAWTRGFPVGTSNGGTPSNPGVDIDGDLGEQCYVTGNGGGGAGNDDIDGGIVRLTSPIIDLTTFDKPVMDIHYWFYNAGGQGAPDDYLNIIVANATEEVVIEQFITSTSAWVGPQTYTLTDFIAKSDDIRIIIESADIGGGHLVESAIDGFSIIEGLPTSVKEATTDAWELEAMPSPFESTTSIQYQLTEETTTAQMQVYNILGQRQATLRLEGNAGTVQIGKNLTEGIYFVQIENAGKVSEALRIVKQK